MNLSHLYQSHNQSSFNMIKVGRGPGGNRWNADLRYGNGMYFAPNSSKSHGSIPLLLSLMYLYRINILSMACINVQLYPVNTSYQHTILTHHINTLYQPILTSYQHMVSIGYNEGCEKVKVGSHGRSRKWRCMFVVSWMVWWWLLLLCCGCGFVVVVMLSFQTTTSCLINPLIFLLVDTLSPPPIDIMSG